MTEQGKDLLHQEVKVVNIGLELFTDALKEQKVQVVHVSWEPPAQGDPDLARMLDLLL